MPGSCIPYYEYLISNNIYKHHIKIKGITTQWSSEAESPDYRVYTRLPTLYLSFLSDYFYYILFITCLSDIIPSAQTQTK
jgi:hypothetical protein